MALDIKSFSQSIGVSTATVSRAFSGNGRISEATKERILEEAKKAGFSPNIHARRLNMKKTGLIGLYYTFADEPIFDYYIMELAQELIKAAEMRDYAIHLELGGSAKGKDVDRLAELTRGHGLDGIILVVDGRSSGLKLLKAVHDCPAAVISGMPWTPVGDEIAIELDIRSGIHEAVKELAKLGHSRIGFIRGTADEGKLAAYKEALEELGLIVDPRLIAKGPLSFADGRNAFNQLAAHSPTAVICSTDVLALGALNEAQRLGIRVPEDTSIVGMDDLAFSAFTTPSLSSIGIPRQQMAKTAVDCLLARFDMGKNLGRRASSKHVINTFFVPRSSVCKNETKKNSIN
ncbi:LacI family DNA-binding transcriptional regulator [Rubellicoccus peritrichatus]|uniref:LacI family DNA-binding transcriptional regulator n=1 Tax=Rubellicoccus peritrichatus TaxID=3080537 RepID=A0AAQ3LF18_9BACT|nr:LacI family DNA-binding transcriptional regulator [Puniceicoccus sp. CR14]WOO40714.1 LacI family DNA-binding transcriptional regulator [Puniceicoccus sp. CR14]